MSFDYMWKEILVSQGIQVWSVCGILVSPIGIIICPGRITIYIAENYMACTQVTKFICLP